jgi:hypothetical protein
MMDTRSLPQLATVIDQNLFSNMINVLSGVTHTLKENQANIFKKLMNYLDSYDFKSADQANKQTIILFLALGLKYLLKMEIDLQEICDQFYKLDVPMNELLNVLPPEESVEYKLLQNELVSLAFAITTNTLVPPTKTSSSQNFFSIQKKEMNTTDSTLILVNNDDTLEKTAEKQVNKPFG